MAFTPSAHTPYQWQDAPSIATPLDAANLIAAEQDLVSYIQSTATSLDAYLEGILAPLDQTSVLRYGAKGDRQTVSDGAMTGSSATLTSATANFSLADVSKTIYVIGAGTSSAVLQTTILAYVSSTNVTLATNASTTVTGAEVVWGTNNYTAFSNAIAANVNGTVTVPPPSKSFYLVDNGGNGSPTNYFTFTGSYLTIKGYGKDSTVVRFGPEGLVTNTNQSNALVVSSSQVLTVMDMTLQGPDTLAGSGPPSNVSTGWASGQGGLGVCNQTGTGTAAAIRFINCHVKHFCGHGVTSGAFEAYYTTFEGYGTSYASMGPFAGDNGTTGYSPTKKVVLDHCVLKNFGDPAGLNFYHSMYVGTSHDIYITNCIFYSPATGATGYMAQHYDSNVALANAGQHAVYENCYFAPGTQYGPLTSYNCLTKFIGCTFPSLTANGINMAGPVEIDDCFIGINAAVNGMSIANQGQTGTGLDWSLQITNSRIKFLSAVVATGISLAPVTGTGAGPNSTSQFNIGYGTVFEGGQSGDGNYINNSSTVGRVNIEHAWFFGDPNNAIRNSGTNQILSKDSHYLMTGGNAIFTTAALTELDWIHNEHLSGANGLNFSTSPTLMRSTGNYGSGWTARNSQSGTTYIIKQYDEFIACSGTASNAIALTLPAASSVAQGQEYVIMDDAGGAGTHNITLTPNGSDTIHATATTISTNWQFMRVRSNGSTGWDRVG